MIFTEIAELITHQLGKESAARVGKKLGRERKAIYFLARGCNFRCDRAFVRGLNELGYDLRLVKLPAREGEAT